MPIISARDVIVQSQSGTGKTAVFCLGALQRIELGVRAPQVLVLSPTRELAEQTQKVALALGDHLNVQIHACLGGKSMQEDIRKLEMGVHMISGTPGRVFDMIQQRHLDLKKIKMFILDEADEMLKKNPKNDKSFRDQVHEIYRFLPYQTQTVIVSATLPNEILEMSKKFMNNPIKILVKRDELTLEGIKQFFIAIDK